MLRRMHPTTSGIRMFHRFGPAPSPDWLRGDLCIRWPTTMRIDQNGRSIKVVTVSGFSTSATIRSAAVLISNPPGCASLRGVAGIVNWLRIVCEAGPSGPVSYTQGHLSDLCASHSVEALPRIGRRSARSPPPPIAFKGLSTLEVSYAAFFILAYFCRRRSFRASAHEKSCSSGSMVREKSSRQVSACFVSALSPIVT